MKRHLPKLIIVLFFLGVLLWRKGWFDFPSAPRTVPPQEIFPGAEVDTYLARNGLTIEYDAADPLQSIKVMTADGAEVETQPALLTSNKALVAFPLDFKATYKARIVTRFRQHENTLSPAKDVRAVALGEFHVDLPRTETARALVRFNPDGEHVLVRTSLDKARLFSLLEMKEVEIDSSPLKSWAAETLQGALELNREKRDAQVRTKWAQILERVKPADDVTALAGSDSWFAVATQPLDKRSTNLAVYRVHDTETELAYTHKLASPAVLALEMSADGKFIAVLTVPADSGDKDTIPTLLQILH